MRQKHAVQPVAAESSAAKARPPLPRSAEGLLYKLPNYDALPGHYSGDRWL
jgi:hypothetical protein